MKNYFYILIPIFLGLVIYSILPQNEILIESNDEDSETKFIKNLVKKNENDPLNNSLEGLLSRVSTPDSNVDSMLIHYHDLWIKNNCNPKCDDNLVRERIEFYNKQPIKHSLFDTVIFNKQIIVPYTQKLLKNCIEYYCSRIVGTHDFQFEYILSNPEQKKLTTLNKEILKFIDFDDLFLQTGFNLDVVSDVDTSNKVSLTVYNDRIVTINNSNYEYSHGAAHGGGGQVQKHYDYKISKFLNYNDIFKSDLESDLLKLIVSKIDNPDSTTNWYIKENLSDLSLWNFEKSGLSFHFGQYTIGGLNMYNKLLTFKELESYLTQFGKSLK